MTMKFENAKVGDKVWDFIYKWGTVSYIEDDMLFIKFSYMTSATFSKNGINQAHPKGSASANIQTLFWDEIKFEIPTQPVRMKMIHGVEVPDIGFEPEIGEDYCFPSISKRHLHSFRTYVEDYNEDMIYVENDLCYPYTEEGKQAAIRHAKAMLGIKETS
jgi:hypothetical protein